MTGKQTRGKLKRIWQRVCDVKGTAAAEALAVVALAVALGTAGFAPAMADDAAPTRPAPALEAAQSESAASADADEVASDEAASAETPAEAEEPAASAPSAQAVSPEGAAQASSPQAQPTQPQNRKLTLQRTIVTASGVHFTIKVAYDEAAGIPEGAELQLAEYGLEPDDPTWRDDPAYKGRPLATERFLTKVEMAKRIAKLAEGLKVEKGDYVFYTKFLDIAIVANGAEVQPQAPVEVTIETDAVDRNVSDAMEVALDISTTSAQFDKTGYRPVTVKNATEHAKDPDNETAEESQGRVKVSFTTDQIANIGLAGVVSPLIVRDEDLGKVAVLGPRSGMGLAAEGMQVSAPDEEAQVLDAFWVRTDPDRDFGTTLWVRNAEARSSVRTIEGITEGVDESTDALVKIDEGAQQASEPATDAIAGWLVNDGSLVGRPFPLGINNVPAAFSAEDGLAIVVGSSISGFEVVDPGSSAEGDQALARYRVTATDGSTYSVSVTFDRTAEIPAGTTLLVTELTGDEYDDYCAQAQEALADQGLLNFARAFDIGFVDKDGNEFEPKAPVEVSIALLNEAARDDLQLLHFGEGGKPELMQAAASQTDETATLDFEAESFSVYLVTAASNPVQVVHSDGSTTGYTSLQAAYDAATDGETVELLQDITVTEKLKFQANKSVTLTTAGSYAGEGGVAKIVRSTSFTSNNSLASVGGSANKTPTLILRNIVVDGSDVHVGEDGALFEVKSGGKGTLILESGAVLQNGYASGGHTGGAVYITGGALRMEEGSVIQHCTAERASYFAGGGVCLWDGDFTMNGGTIRDCHAPNSAGGGIAINHDEMGTINGGLITECTSKEGGAGIEHHGKALYMTGGAVTGNNGGTSGGVDFYAHHEGAFYLSGSPRIYGNTASDGSARNVSVKYFHDGDFNNNSVNILVDGDLASDALVGVSGDGTFDVSTRFGKYTTASVPQNLNAFFKDDDETRLGAAGSSKALVWENGARVEAVAYLTGHPETEYAVAGSAGAYRFESETELTAAAFAQVYETYKGYTSSLPASAVFAKAYQKSNGAEFDWIRYVWLSSRYALLVADSSVDQYYRYLPAGDTLVLAYEIQPHIKLTDGNGRLLYLSDGSMAIFDELDDAFAALGKCYETSSATTAYTGADYQVMMLVGSHTQTKPVTHATGSYNVTLTTEGGSPADGLLPGPGNPCVIANGGVNARSMIRTELPSLTVENVVIDGAGVENASRGAIIEMAEGAHSLTIGEATLRNGWSSNQGGAVFAGKGTTLTVNDGAVFSGNKSEGDGGAIAAAEETTLAIGAATFTGNTADQFAEEVTQNGVATTKYTAGGGGAIALFNTAKGSMQAVLTATGTTFDSNTATGDGGAIRTGEQCSVTLTNCTMTGNAAQGEGGAVVAKSKQAQPSSILVDGGSYKRNSAGSAKSGGALRIGGYGTLTVKGDAVIGGADADGNSAPNGGAIAAAANATVTIESGDISYNTAIATPYTEEKDGITYSKLDYGRGGAIFLENSGGAGSALNITGGSISHNTAQNEGGGVYGMYVTALVSDATFEADQALGAITVTGHADWQELTSINGGAGGAMRLTSGTLTVQRATFKDCFALTGGALETNGTTATVFNSRFEGCTTHYNAGAFNIHGGNVRIEGTTSFDKCRTANPNSARYTGNGGAIYVDSLAHFVIAGTGAGVTFTDCYARRDGGAIDYSDSRMESEIENCHFANCEASGNSGGAFCCYIKALTLTNTTIDNCRCGYLGGAICGVNGGGVYNVTDCVFTNNRGGSAGGAIWTANNSTVNIADSSFIGNWCYGGSAIDEDGTGNKINLSGDVYIYDNKNGEVQKNIGLRHDANTIINVANAGLTETSKIGVYVSGGTDEAMYKAHGDAGMPFGTYYCDEYAYLYNFVNDRNGLTGTVYKESGDDRKVYWREPLVSAIVQKDWDASVTADLIALNKDISFQVAGDVGDAQTDVDSYTATTKSAALQSLSKYSSCVIGGEETAWADVAFVPLYADALNGQKYATYQVTEGSLLNYAGRGEWDEPIVSVGTADSWSPVAQDDTQVAYARVKRSGAQGGSVSEITFDYTDDSGTEYESKVSLGGSVNLGSMGDSYYIELRVPKHADLNALTLLNEPVAYDEMTFLPMRPAGVANGLIVSGSSSVRVFIPKERTFVITNAYTINEKSFTVVKKWNDGTEDIDGDDERVENLEVSFTLYQVGLSEAPVIGPNVPMPTSLKVSEPTVNGTAQNWSSYVKTATSGEHQSIPETLGFFYWESSLYPEDTGYYYVYNAVNSNMEETDRHGPAAPNLLQNNTVKYTGKVWSPSSDGYYDQNGHLILSPVHKGDLIYDDGKYYVVINGESSIEWPNQSDRYRLIDGGSIGGGGTPGTVVVDNYTTQDEAEGMRATLRGEGYVVKSMGTYTIRKSEDLNNEWFAVALDLPEGYGYYVVEMSVRQLGTNAILTNNFTPTYDYSQDNKVAVITNTFNTQSQKVILKKIDDSTKQPLEGAEFDLMTTTGELLNQGKLVSTANGVFYVGDLFYNTYYLKETTVPAGYGDADKWFRVDVAASGTTITPLAEAPTFEQGGGGVDPEKEITNYFVTFEPEEANDRYMIDRTGVKAVLNVLYDDETTGVYAGSVDWTSYDTSVATVSAAGALSFQGVGMANIAASVNGKTVTSKNVSVMDYGVAISPTSTVRVGQSGVMASAVLRYGNNTTGSYYGGIDEWAIADTSVADIDQFGRITPKAVGITQVRAKIDGRWISAPLTVIESLNPSGETIRMVTQPGEDGYYHVTESVQLELWTGFAWVSTADVAWAFSISGTGGSTSYNTDGTGVHLNSVGASQEITLTATINTGSLWVDGMQVQQGLSGTITIPVKDKVETTLNTVSLSGREGESGAVSVDYKINNVSQDATSHLSYESSDPSVAAGVDGSTTINYLKASDDPVTITVKFDGVEIGTVAVTVSAKPSGYDVRTDPNAPKSGSAITSSQRSLRSGWYNDPNTWQLKTTNDGTYVMAVVPQDGQNVIEMIYYNGHYYVAYDVFNPGTSYEGSQQKQWFTTDDPYTISNVLTGAVYTGRYGGSLKWVMVS